MRLVLPALAALALGTARADEPAKKDPSKSDLPLQLRLVAKKAAYKLDVDSKDLKKQLKDAEKSGRYPAPPKVDLVLEIENRTDKEVSFWVAGDPVKIDLQLKGPGAVSARPSVFFTQEFRAPRPMALAAGKKHTIPITQLKYGHRGGSAYAYWTEPGEYTLTASLSTAISPAPKGVKADQGGFARVTLTSEPVKIKVEGK